MASTGGRERDSRAQKTYSPRRFLLADPNPLQLGWELQLHVLLQRQVLYPQSYRLGGTGEVWTKSTADTVPPPRLKGLPLAFAGCKSLHRHLILPAANVPTPWLGTREAPACLNLPLHQPALASLVVSAISAFQCCTTNACRLPFVSSVSLLGQKIGWWEKTAGSQRARWAPLTMEWGDALCSTSPGSPWPRQLPACVLLPTACKWKPE